MAEETLRTLSTNCLACQGVGKVHSYTGECVKICPACQGQHRPHTYKEGCKKFVDQEPKAEQPVGAPAPAASSPPKPSQEVTRKRAVVGDPDLDVDNPGVNK